MSWTTPRTWTPTELVTETLLNAQVRDNAKALAVAVRVRNSASISLSSATWTALTFDTEDYDIDGMHSATANSSRFTCNTPGLYEFRGLVYASTLGAPDGLGLRILRNDSTANLYGYGFVEGYSTAVGSTATYRGTSVFGIHTLSTGQWLTLQACAPGTTSTATVVAVGYGSPGFYAKWLSAT